MNNSITYEQLIDVNKEICIICLEFIELDDKYNKNICDKCSISVHKECIDKWFKEKEKKMCPICLDYEEVNNNNYNYTYLIIFNLLKYLTFTALIIFIYLFFK